MKTSGRCPPTYGSPSAMKPARIWICRALQARHIDCYVIDAASIPAERHQRRAKTDRLDIIKLVINLRAWLRGERDRMHVIRVPLPEVRHRAT